MFYIAFRSIFVILQSCSLFLCALNLYFCVIIVDGLLTDNDALKLFEFKFLFSVFVAPSFSRTLPWCYLTPLRIFNDVFKSKRNCRMRIVVHGLLYNQLVGCGCASNFTSLDELFFVIIVFRQEYILVVFLTTFRIWWRYLNILMINLFSFALIRVS